MGLLIRLHNGKDLSMTLSSEYKEHLKSQGIKTDKLLPQNGANRAFVQQVYNCGCIVHLNRRETVQYAKAKGMI